MATRSEGAGGRVQLEQGNQFDAIGITLLCCNVLCLPLIFYGTKHKLVERLRNPLLQPLTYLYLTFTSIPSPLLSFPHLSPILSSGTSSTRRKVRTYLIPSCGLHILYTGACVIPAKGEYNDKDEDPAFPTISYIRSAGTSYGTLHTQLGAPNAFNSSSHLHYGNTTHRNISPPHPTNIKQIHHGFLNA